MKFPVDGAYRIFVDSKYLYIVIVCIILQLLFPYKQKSYPAQRFKSWYISFMLGFTTWACYVVVTMTIFPLLDRWNLYGKVPYFKNFHPVIRFCVLLFIIDAIIYWNHYVFHNVKFLRKVHNVHHVEHYVDAMSAFRVHFIEILSFVTLLVGVYYPLGVTVDEFIIMIIITQIIGATSHADLRLPYRLEILLDKVFCTSGFHMHHHSVNTKEANENFSMLLNIWDRLNKTYHKPEKGRKYEFGTQTDLEASNSLVKNLFLRLPYSNGAGLRAYKRKKE